MPNCTYQERKNGKVYVEEKLPLLYRFRHDPLFKAETLLKLRNHIDGKYFKHFDDNNGYADALKLSGELNTGKKYPTIAFGVKKVIGEKSDTRTYYVVYAKGYKTNALSNNNIDFLPSSEAMKASNYKELLKTLKNQYFSYETKLTATSLKINATNDVATLRKLTRTQELLQKKLENLDIELENAAKVSRLEDLRSYAENHISRVKELMSDTMSTEDITEAQRYITLWQRVGDFSNNNNPFFTDIELESESLKYGYVHPVTNEKIKGFADYKNEMDELNRKLNTLNKEHVTKHVNNVLNSDYSVEDVFKATVDIGSLPANFLDLGRANDPLAVATHKVTKLASYRAEQEATALFKTLDQLVEDVTPSLKKYKKNNDLWNIFMQEDKAGNQTGNYVMPISQDFWDESSKVYRKLKSKKPNEKGYADVLQEYLAWNKENKLIFDPRILFPTSQNDLYHYPHSYSATYKENLLNELKRHMGEKQFNYEHAKAEQDIKKFKLLYEVKKAELSESELEKWDKENSPYYAAKSIIDGEAIKVNNEYVKTQGYRFLKSVPKKFKSDGSLTGWVDKKYEKIESDPKLLQFYEGFTSIMSDLAMILPDHLKNDMQVNTLPTIRKTVFDEMASSGIQSASAHMFNQLITSMRANNLSDEVYSKTDAFGKIEKTVQINISDNKKLIENSLRLKIINYKSENGVAPDYDTLKKMKAEVQNELSKNKSHDLGKIAKAYAAELYMYKHKSKIEDLLRLSAHLMAERDHLETNVMGKVLKDPVTGKPLPPSKKLDNYIMLMENHIDNAFGISTRKVEGVFKNKTLTSKEKEELNILEKGKIQLENELNDLNTKVKSKTITKSEAEVQAKKIGKEQKKINTQIERLGGKVTVSKLVDKTLAWVQLKTMALNLPSAFANILFGDLANMIAASDGRVFNEAEFLKARRLTISSQLKLTGIPTKTANKISAWMQKLDIHKQASQEIKDPTKNIVSNKTKLLHPFGVQEASEYMVYAPVLVAMMLHEKVSNGVITSNLWEVLDETGNIPDGWVLENTNTKVDQLFLENFKVKVDHMIKKTHGNYDPDSPINIKNSSLGKLISQFRSWMFEGVANRFENEKYDDILKITTKGRWRSYGQLNSVSNILFTTKQLLRKLSLAGIVWDRGNSTTQFNERFNETDAANLKANLTELTILMSLIGVGMVLKALNGDDEDDDTFILNFLINQMGRLQTDILLYANPNEFEKLQSNVIPASVFINDIGRWFDASLMAIEGKDALKSGPEKGESRLLRETARMFPYGSAFYKTKRQVEDTFD